MPTCSICGNDFTPQYKSTEKACRESDCRYKFAMAAVEKKRERDAKKAWGKEKKIIKDKLKTLSEFESDAKKSFQKWIRKRDEHLPCISCGIGHTELWDGGHFYKAELYSGLIFDERNVNKQCRKCNRYLGGNEMNYREGLIARHGIEFVTKLTEDSNLLRNKKFTKEELIGIKNIYDKRYKELK